MKAGSCAVLIALGALGACGKSPEAVQKPLTGKLDLEITDSAQVSLSIHGDDLTATVTPDKGYGVMPANKPLSGPGHVEHFPEADATLYTARFSAPADASGPCKDKPVSLALALHRDEDNARVQGSLTPYCGKDVWFGIPAHTVLRLSGDLPLPK